MLAALLSARRAGVALLLAGLAAPAAAAVTVSFAANLSFGALAAGSGGGSVVMSPGGMRTPTGVILPHLGPGGQAAAFTLANPGDTAYQCEIVLPESVEVSTTSGAKMQVSSFTFTVVAPASLVNDTTISVPAGVSAGAIHVGAKLTVAGGQAWGSYEAAAGLTLELSNCTPEE